MPSPTPHDASEVIREVAATGAMGLRGVWATVGQMSAMGVLIVLFYLTWNAQLQQAHEDRALFREVTDRQWTAIRETQSQQLQLMHSVQENQQTLTSLTRAVQEMGVELREINRLRREATTAPEGKKPESD